MKLQAHVFVDSRTQNKNALPGCLRSCQSFVGYGPVVFVPQASLLLVRNHNVMQPLVLSSTKIIGQGNPQKMGCSDTFSPAFF